MRNDYVSETHHWRSVDAIQVGDLVHRWGDDLKVLEVQRKDGHIYLFWEEPGGKLVHAKYKPDDEIICKRI